METIITLQDRTVIKTNDKDVVSIAVKVKITSKIPTHAMQERDKVESTIFNRIDRGNMRVQRAINQRELRRVKRA